MVSFRPLTIGLSHSISRYMKLARTKGILPWLLPDTKTQITVEYMEDNGKTIPLRVHTIVLTAQHTSDVTVEGLREAILNQVIRKVIPSKYLNEKTNYHVGNLFFRSLLSPSAR